MRDSWGMPISGGATIVGIVGAAAVLHAVGLRDLSGKSLLLFRRRELVSAASAASISPMERL